MQQCPHEGIGALRASARAEAEAEAHTCTVMPADDALAHLAHLHSRVTLWAQDVQADAGPGDVSNTPFLGYSQHGTPPATAPHPGPPCARSRRSPRPPPPPPVSPSSAPGPRSSPCRLARTSRGGDGTGARGPEESAFRSGQPGS